MQKLTFFAALICSMLFAGTAMATETLVVGGVEVPLSGSDVVNVTGDNITTKNNTFGIGAVTYTPSTKTLKLNNVTIRANAENGNGIESNVNNLTIETINSSTVFAASNGTALLLNAKTTITGQNELLVAGANGQDGVYFADTLTFNKANVTIQAVLAGISGLTANDDVLVIKRSAVSVTNTQSNVGNPNPNIATVCNVKNVILSECQYELINFEQPVFDATLKGIKAYSGATTLYSKGTLNIEPDRYGLYIAGKEVNALNRDNITWQGVQGKVTFAHTTRILTLENVIINQEFMPAFNDAFINGIVYTGEDRWGRMLGDLTIELIGQNEVKILPTGTPTPAVCFNQDVKIINHYQHPDASLKITSPNSYAIGFGNTQKNSTRTLKLDRTNIIIDCQSYSFVGQSQNQEGPSKDILYIFASNVDCLNGGIGVSGIDSLKLQQNCKFTSHENVTLKDGHLTNPDNYTIQSFKIERYSNYPLYIGGEDVTSLNKNNIFGDGKVNYNPETKTLTIKEGANIPVANYGISSTLDSLIIQFEGDSVDIVANQRAMNLQENTTIRGDGGTYKLKGTLYVKNDKNLTIENIGTLDIVSTESYGIRGGHILDLSGLAKGDTVRAKGTLSPIASFKSIITNHNAALVEPKDAYYDETIYVITFNPLDGGVDGTFYNATFVGVQTYDLWIDGIQATDDNLDEIGEYSNASFDPITKTLTLDKSNIGGSFAPYVGDICIHSKIEDLTIVLNQYNSITCDVDIVAMKLEGNTTIRGTNNGSLYTEGGILIGQGKTLTIEDCTLDIYDNTTANYGLKGDDSHLVVALAQNQTIDTEGQTGVVTGFASITLLNNTIISAPANAHFNATLKAVTTDDLTPVNGNSTVTFKGTEPYTPTFIENVFDTHIFARNGRIYGAKNARIYDILGRDVTKNNGSLKGVYMVKSENTAQKIVVR